MEGPRKLFPIHTGSGSSHNTSAFLRTTHHVLSEGSCGTARGSPARPVGLVRVAESPLLCLERRVVWHSRPRLCLDLFPCERPSQMGGCFPTRTGKFSHAAAAHTRRIQIRHKCQGMSLLMPLSRSKNQIPCCRRPGVPGVRCFCACGGGGPSRLLA